MRPKQLESIVTRIKTGYGKMFVIISEVDKKPFEVFCILGKSGQSIQAKAEVTGRLVSLALQNGVAVDKIIDQLEGITGDNQIMSGDYLVKSIPDGVAKILRDRYKGGKNEN